MTPTPIPQTIRPATRVAIFVAVQKGIAPTVVMAIPKRIVFLRPRICPTRKAKIDPAKAPRLYLIHGSIGASCNRKVDYLWIER